MSTENTAVKKYAQRWRGK